MFILVHKGAAEVREHPQLLDSTAAVEEPPVPHVWIHHEVITSLNIGYIITRMVHLRSD
jgi:hypothetical protein